MSIIKHGFQSFFSCNTMFLRTCRKMVGQQTRNLEKALSAVSTHTGFLCISGWAWIKLKMTCRAVATTLKKQTPEDQTAVVG